MGKVSEFRKEKMTETRRKLLGLFFGPSGETQCRSWEELRKGTGLSESGLYKISQELRKSGELHKRLDENGKKVWELSKVAINREKKDIWYLANIVQELRKAHAMYRHGTDPLGLYNFGVYTDSIFDKNTPPNYLPADLDKNIAEYTFGRVTQNFRDNKITIKDLSESRTVLALEIDWHAFARSLRMIQSFITCIKTGKDIFSDSVIDFNRERFDLPENEKIKDIQQIEGLKLYRLDFLIEFSTRFADSAFRRKLKAYLKRFSSTLKFYEITGVDPKLFNRVVEKIGHGEGKRLLASKTITKTLFPKIGGHLTDLFDRYIKAARIFKYGDADFISKLNEFEEDKNKKWEMLSLAEAARQKPSSGQTPV